MVRCSVKWCKSDSGTKIPGLSFHSFPESDNLRWIWIEATGRQTDWTPKLSSKICSRHFEKKDLIKKKKLTLLLPNAVPIVLEQDMANYRQYKMGFSQFILMAEGAVPSKFDCQLNCRKMVSNTSMSRTANKKCLKSGSELEFQDAGDTLEPSKDNDYVMPEVIVEIIEMPLFSANFSVDGYILPVFNQQTDGNGGIFPSKFEMQQKWIAIVRKSRHDDEWMWNKFCRVCSEHFTDEEFYSTKVGMRKLLKTAIPKIQALFLASTKSDDEDDVDDNDVEPRKTSFSTNLSEYSKYSTSIEEESSTNDGRNSENIFVSSERHPTSEPGTSASDHDYDNKRRNENPDYDDVDSGDVTSKGNLDIVHVNVTLPKQEGDTPTGYKCSVCTAEIKGFRYTCLECVDWDLCPACETRGEHSSHYVLRVPPARAMPDSNKVLAGIRKYIEDLMQLAKEITEAETSIKEEIIVKEEAMDEEPTHHVSEDTQSIPVMSFSVPEVNVFHQGSSQYLYFITNPPEPSNVAPQPVRSEVNKPWTLVGHAANDALVPNVAQASAKIQELDSVNTVHKPC